jgi:hypothetical protein
MSIRHNHHSGADHQAPVDRMINEFLEARSRRFGKSNGNVVDATLDANVNPPRAGTTIATLHLLRTDRS